MGFTFRHFLRNQSTVAPVSSTIWARFPGVTSHMRRRVESAAASGSCQRCGHREDFRGSPTGTENILTECAISMTINYYHHSLVNVVLVRYVGDAPSTGTSLGLLGQLCVSGEEVTCLSSSAAYRIISAPSHSRVMALRPKASPGRRVSACAYIGHACRSGGVAHFRGCGLMSPPRAEVMSPPMFFFSKRRSGMPRVSRNKGGTCGRETCT